MKIIYWTITWFGLDLLDTIVYYHYTGLEYGAVYSNNVLGLSALVMMIIWVIGCFYFADK